MAKKVKQIGSVAKKGCGASRASKTIDPEQFLQRQVDALSAPLEPVDVRDLPHDEERGDSQLPQDVVNKAVLALDKNLQEARQRKLNQVAVQAISEQIQYLHQMQTPKAGQNVDRKILQSDGSIRVDKDDWLDELPAEWPNEGESSRTGLIGRYSSLLDSVRSLSQQQRYLQQETAHYDDLLVMAERHIDLAALREIVGAPIKKTSLDTAGHGKKRKAR